MGVSLRPIDRWPGPETINRRWAPFKASVGSTLNVLERELRMLDAKLVVLEVDYRERDIRLDGLPRADARMTSPRVQIAFDSKWGPLQYATDEFTHWDDNLRGIALAMEALRKVDRYGVSKRGEQYQGWRQLTTGTDNAFGLYDRREAERWLLDTYGDGYEGAGAVAATLRRAIKATHPDAGGDDEEFRKVMRAKSLLG